MIIDLIFQSWTFKGSLIYFQNTKKEAKSQHQIISSYMTDFDWFYSFVHFSWSIFEMSTLVVLVTFSCYLLIFEFVCSLKFKLFSSRYIVSVVSKHIFRLSNCGVLRWEKSYKFFPMETHG